MDVFRKKLYDAFELPDSKTKRSKVRNSARALHLVYALSKSEEPQFTFVLATADGRVLEKLENGSVRLDLGDNPQLWDKDAALVRATRWNRDNPEADHVSLVYWRDFYQAQIIRIETR